MIVRYLLEKCKNVSEAVSCLYQLPIASAQTLTLADAMGTITVIECNAEQIKVEKTLNNNLLCLRNKHFHFPEMIGYNNDKIDNWFAEERYQTLYSAFNRKMEVSIFHLQKNCCLGIMVFSASMTEVLVKILSGQSSMI